MGHIDSSIPAGNLQIGNGRENRSFHIHTNTGIQQVGSQPVRVDIAPYHAILPFAVLFNGPPCPFNGLNSIRFLSLGTVISQFDAIFDGEGPDTLTLSPSGLTSSAVTAVKTS